MKAWVKHYDRLLNVKFDWPRNELPVLMTADPTQSVSRTLICGALSKMKCSKASDIIAQMLKASRKEGVELVRQLLGAVFCSGEIPADWEDSFILSLYKGNDEGLAYGNCHSLKLTYQVLKVHKWLLVCPSASWCHQQNAVGWMTWGWGGERGGCGLHGGEGVGGWLGFLLPRWHAVLKWGLW